MSNGLYIKRDNGNPFNTKKRLLNLLRWMVPECMFYFSHAILTWSSVSGERCRKPSVHWIHSHNSTLQYGNTDRSVYPSQVTTIITTQVQGNPTIPHCSMATLIGLSIRVKLLRSLPPRFKVIPQFHIAVWQHWLVCLSESSYYDHYHLGSR